MGLVRNQLQTFEDWGEVRSWTINLRKAEQDALIKENKNGLTYKDYICWERFLVPYLGVGKTYAQVREVLNVVERKFNEPEYRHRDKKLKTFPGVEFLPARQKAKEVKKPVAKKGETVYKKITLDQPAFSRKTRANTELIKEMAAKKRQTSSHTPSSSGTPSKKVKSPDTDDASDTSPSTKKHKTSATDSAANDTNHHKRKSVDTDTVTTTQPFQRRSLLTKRRRLTRGYEKHGSEGEDTSFMEEAEREDTTFVEKSDDDDRTFLNDRRFKK